jgi:hypothetical protein
LCFSLTQAAIAQFIVAILAAFTDDHALRLAMIYFAAAPVVAAISAYVIFMFRDPDRLQSEEYRIRQSALKMLYKRGGNTEIVDVANQTPRIEVSQPRSGNGEKE